jgi:hypothetical protein
MSDRICVALPDGRWLALDRETFVAALAAGAELVASALPSPSASTAAEPLLDADQAAAQLNVTARWLEDSARAGIIPITSSAVSSGSAYPKSLSTVSSKAHQCLDQRIVNP